MPVINQLITSRVVSRVLFAVRGYHIYKDIWSAEIDSELPCCPESGNREDRYAVRRRHALGHATTNFSRDADFFIVGIYFVERQLPGIYFRR